MRLLACPTLGEAYFHPGGGGGLFPLPAEKAMKASLFLNPPLSSRKWVGSKSWGFLNCMGSNWEVQSRGMTLRSWD